MNGLSFFHCVASPFHSFVTTLRTRGQFRVARLARQDKGATSEQPNIPLLQQLSGVSDGGLDYVSASYSDGAFVGAPTRAPCLESGYVYLYEA